VRNDCSSTTVNPRDWLVVPNGWRRIKATEWPDPAFVDVGVRGDLSEFTGLRFADRATYTGVIAPVKFIDAVAGVMRRRMATDESIVVIGEDIHRLSGGTNGATKGLKEAYPDRILGTPISENAFTGLAGGLALDGRYNTRRGVHVRRLHVGRSRPTVQPDRQSPPHVRRQLGSPARPEIEGCDGHRLRIPALHGPRRGFRNLARLAHRRAIDPVRLRRADERRPRLQGSWSMSTSTDPSEKGPSTTTTTAFPSERPPFVVPAARSPS